MFEEKRNQKIARIIEIPIPVEYFDMLQDLVSYYGNNDKAILEAIRSHHRETFGTLDDFKLTITHTHARTSRKPSIMNTPVTDARLAKIIDNGKRIDKKTQQEIEKVDNILDKLEDLSALKEIKDEISSMKSMIERIQATGGISPRTRGPKADLSSLEVDIDGSVEGVFSPPERPLLDSVLDSMLFFDEEELLEETETSDEENKNNEKEEE